MMSTDMHGLIKQSSSDTMCPPVCYQFIFTNDYFKCKFGLTIEENIIQDSIKFEMLLLLEMKFPSLVVLI